MSRMMDREGYLTKLSNKKWVKRSNRLYEEMERFLTDFYKDGGTVAEGLLCIIMEAWRAEQNTKVLVLNRDGEYQKSLRRKRRKNSTRRTT